MSPSDDNPHGYAADIWRLFSSAPRAGGFDAGMAGVVVGRAGTPAARSVLELSLRFDGDRVVDARFRAYGCPTTIAVGAWLAAAAVGCTVAELGRLDARALRTALEIAEDRAHCALLGEDALHAAVTRHEELHR